MAEKRIQFSNIVQNQLPSYVKEEFPLISDFLKQYYIAQEFQGAPIDLIQNIDEYIKISELTHVVDSVVLDTALGYDDTTIEVDAVQSPKGTEGFPDTYGLLKINDEIITYTAKTSFSFTGCIRGFSGITSYEKEATTDQLVFTQSEAAEHEVESTISNLSSLFLKQFLLKSKHQLTPGLEDRTLTQNLNQEIFIKQAKDFYLSKGTDKSFEILFKALYDEEVRIVRPKDFLFTPSNAEYRITNDLVVESIPDGGDPMDLEQSTLFQYPFESNPHKAYAPITSVEKISPSIGGTYYKISIDAGYNRDVRVEGSIYGSFSVQPSTQIIGQVAAGSTVLDVDSTVGFGATGDLFVTYNDSTTGVVSYTSKSLTQFFGVDEITGTLPNASIVGINTFAFGSSFSDQDETILVRINSVLKDLEYEDNTHYYSAGDTAKIKTLGIGATAFKPKNWFYNVAPIYKVDSLTLADASDKSYSVVLGVDHIFKIGDAASIIDSNDVTRSTQIINVTSANTVLIRGQGTLPTETYRLRRDISKVQSNTFPKAEIYASNVQNVYLDDERLLIASPSLPTYANQPLDVSSQKSIFTTTVDEGATNIEIGITGDHGFYTGDMVYYIPQKVEEEYFNSVGTKKYKLVVKSSFFPSDVGFVCLEDVSDTTETELIPNGQKLYFIKRVDQTTVKLSYSKDQIYADNFIAASVTVALTDNILEPYDFKFKTLESQRLLREISPAQTDGVTTETLPGFTGILVNGVEVLNYKSRDRVYYGKINEIEVQSSGADYDIINPPLLLLEDPVGTAATGYPALSGNLREIRVSSPGFDYQETPVVTITGGNGKGAVASANMKQITHSVDFDSEAFSEKVSLGSTQSTIGFSTFHKFGSGEQVFYITGGQQNIGGITTESPYYVSLVGLTTVKLHKTQGDALAGINTVELTSYGVGKQSLQSYFQKSVVDSINVLDSGSGYQNKTRTTGTTGVSTSLDQITIDNHDYASGEVVKYTSTTDTGISGLSVGTEYYVTRVDDDKFKLSAVGVASDKEYNYRTKQYVDLTSVGVGTQRFDYPAINVTLTGKVGIASTGLETFECEVQPIFRGEVTSIHLSNQGVGYGSSEVLNFVREPEVSLVSGNDAQLTPIIVDGAISEVVVLNVGQKYNSAPNLTITGDGVGGIITPVFENNQITSVKVISGGSGYVQASTTVTVVFPGSGVSLRPLLQTWTVNIFQRNLDKFTGDDGYIAHEFNKNRGLQYSALYAPRKLREVMFATDQTGVKLYGDKDLKRVASLEVASDQHSPIIGWAYDGNPIYGPYGYITNEGGIVSQMRSGYSLSIDATRPPTSLWGEGFFVEDYTYKDVVDNTVLDENNGRFCVTPEYPEGTYAYFATIESGSTDSSGPFMGYKRPVFPYLIGDNYNSLLNDFNHAHTSNQDTLDLQNSKWLRNTHPYNLIEGTLNYEYVYIPNDLTQSADIKGVTPGGVTSVGIQTGGDLYQVEDPIVFDNEGTQGYAAAAQVSQLKGKTVTSVSVAQSIITGVELYSGEENGQYIAFSTNPHNFKNKDNIIISGLSTTSSEIGGYYNVGVVTSKLIVTGVGTTSSGIATVGVTGFVTHFNVSGDLNSIYQIRSNDILGIGTEKVKVLNVEPQLSRIRVLRAVEGTVGGAHTVTSVLYPDQRKLTFDAGFKTSYSVKQNEQIYFQPSETVGLGTTAGVGIGSTLVFSNPGTGLSELFIPTKALYIPGHELSTGDELTYSPGNGTGLAYWENATSGVATLTDGQKLYAGVINQTLVGLATTAVGLGSTGSFVGIHSTSSTTLFFSGVGTGVYHSLKTNYGPITATLTRNLVTVATGTTHGLINNDVVDVDVNPETTGFTTVKYNDYNRKVLIDAQPFTAVGVNTSTNTFTITDHGFVMGQKVVYTSSSPIEGLTNNGIYYVVRESDSEFKLSDTYYNSTKLIPFTIGITSTSAGTLSPVNPALKFYKNSSIEFDMSDSSLAYTVQSTDYPAFELNFYTDENFTQLWNKGILNKDFQVTRSGQVGTSGAKVTLTVNDNAPNILHYKLDPLEESTLPVVKEEINIDTEVISNNQVEILESDYNGQQTITVGGTNTFTYTLPQYPEAVSYAATTSSLGYETISTNAYGPITEFEIKNKGSHYYSLPGITTITTSVGKGAIIEAASTTIGEVKKTQINNIGYNFPVDTTLRPTVELPQLIDIEALASFEFIGITSGGRGYSSAPELRVLDGKTEKEITDVDLKYSLGDSQVTILKNTFGMSNTTPTILPVHNSNGVGISTVGFNTITKEVSLTLSVGFSTANSFPFRVDDKILVENVSVGVASTGVGYNSVDYGYKLFDVTAVDENLGGIGTVYYNIEGVLASKPTGSIPGTFDSANSSGRVIPQQYFPLFDIHLKTNEYLTAETVKSNSATGIVESWNPKSGLLKISSGESFAVNETIRGQSSGTQGVASSITSYTSSFNYGPTSKVLHGWQVDSGWLNYNLQRIQDSDYYQRFAYSLRSKVTYDTWDDVVSTLNHSLGFKKFSDYQLESKAQSVVGLTTDQTAVDIVSDLVGFGNINCVYDFDLVKENSLVISDQVVSDEIVFSSRILQDYYESVGNRVLSIDDMSGTFNSNPRPTKYSVVDTFDLTAVRSNKYLCYIRDKRYVQQRQLMIVDLLHDGSFGFINQYGRIDTVYDQGSFDFKIVGTEGQLQFYPTKYSVNDYWITTLSYNLEDSYLGVGATTFGDVVIIDSDSVEVPSGTTTNVVSIAATYTSLKILANITADVSGNDNEFEFDEINILHDGTDVAMLEYGQLSTEISDYSTLSGLGTWYPYISGSNLKVDFIPNAGIGTTGVINTLQVGFASETSSGIGTQDLNHVRLEAKATTIASSGTPGINTIAQYPDTYDSAYFIVQVTDTTNNEHQTTEIIVVDQFIEDSTITVDTYETQFADLYTSAGLGTFGSRVSTAGTTSLVFTPNASIACKVKVFMNALYHPDDPEAANEIDFTNAYIRSAFGSYTGTDSDILRAFGLQHKNRDIFERYFTGNDSAVVDVTNNTITIPDHFWVTGERLKYKHVGSATSAVGIASTSFAGVGFTEYLPENPFVVKVDADTIKLASSAENALKVVPDVIDITSVGIGTSHRFVSTNQNAKAVVALDNIIQSPLVSTAVTTTLADQILDTTNVIEVSGITSIFGADLIKVGDEVMKVTSVGVGTTNALRVSRGWMGTRIAGFGTGDLVTKVIGNYNIVDNVLNFVEAPYGLTPLSSTTNQPDDRDWVGISTHSTFQGRTFMRSGVSGGSTDTYAQNYVFDSLHGFNGVTRDFTLTSNNENVTGIKTESFLLVNDVYQASGSNYQYTITESSGISTVNWVGTATSIGTDPGGSNIPMGGALVSVGSSEGFGYQPLISAGGTAVVSSAGTVSSIAIGNSGSGYRSGVTSSVNVAIKTESLTGVNLTPIGTATVTNGYITGIAVTNTHVFASPKTISNVGYNSTTGVTTVTTHKVHGYSQGDEVELSGIAFTCSYAAPLDISTVGYHTASGIMTVTTSAANGFAVGRDVIFTGLGFTCSIDAGITTHYYPRGGDPAYDTAISIAATTATAITVDVGYAAPNNQFTHTFVGVGTSAVLSGGDYTHQFVSAEADAVITGGDYTHTFVSVGVGTITIAGIGSTVVTDASYTASTGALVLTVGSGHTYTTSDTVGIGTSALIFTCSMDDNATQHDYPRSTDPVIGINTAITSIGDSTITVNVGASPFVYYDVSDAAYTPTTGDLVLTVGSHSLTTSTSIRLEDSSLSFRCAKDNYSSIHTYPRSTDPGFSTALSITGTTSDTLTINVGVTTIQKFTVSAANYSANTGILTMTIGAHTLTTGETIKLAEESLTFSCSKDSNSTYHRYPRKPDPTYAGTPVTAVNSTTEFEVNVGISTVASYFKGSGTVQGTIVAPRTSNNSASKQDPAAKEVTVLEVLDNKKFIVNTGTSTCAHHYARGGNVQPHLEVVIDDPLSYSNIPLVYASGSAGVGTEATIDIQVGQGSSVIEFRIGETGYGYGQGESLTVGIGGTVGIPTTSSYKEFLINIDRVFDDEFNGWSLGYLYMLDNLDDKFDGVTQSFTLTENGGDVVSIRAGKGSNIDVQDVILVFINDILQVPGQGYKFSGGSVIEFTEAPKKDDTSKLIFYKGSGDSDVVFKDIIETVKIGDNLTIGHSPSLGQGKNLQEDSRGVQEINSTDLVTTNPYYGPGNSADETLVRPVNWCRQTEDMFVNDLPIGKDRDLYEPRIHPFAYITKTVGIGSTTIYVDTLRPIFDSQNENVDSSALSFQNKVLFVAQETKTSAAATAIVSGLGTISSIDITEGGVGYSTATLSIGSTVQGGIGIGTTTTAFGSLTIANGVITGAAITNPGYGYTTDSPPKVLISPPVYTEEGNSVNVYAGDQGEIVGFGTTTISGGTQFIMDLHIPDNSFLRNSTLTGTAITISGISTNDYFVVEFSNVGIATTSITALNSGGGTTGVGTAFIDNVYEVNGSEIVYAPTGLDSSGVGIGTTYLNRVFVKIDGDFKPYTTVGITTSNFYGSFSWGRIDLTSRSGLVSYTAYTGAGIGTNGTGISTSMIVQRTNKLKSKNYAT